MMGVGGVLRYFKGTLNMSNFPTSSKCYTVWQEFWFGAEDEIKYSMKERNCIADFIHQLIIMVFLQQSRV